MIIDNGAEVTIPIQLFSSNGEGTGFSKETWQGFQTNFVSKNINRTIIILDSPHYVHDYEYESISTEITLYITDLAD